MDGRPTLNPSTGGSGSISRHISIRGRDGKSSFLRFARILGHVLDSYRLCLPRINLLVLLQIRGIRRLLSSPGLRYDIQTLDIPISDFEVAIAITHSRSLAPRVTKTAYVVSTLATTLQQPASRDPCRYWRASAPMCSESRRSIEIRRLISLGQWVQHVHRTLSNSGHADADACL